MRGLFSFPTWRTTWHTPRRPRSKTWCSAAASAFRPVRRRRPSDGRARPRRSRGRQHHDHVRGREHYSSRTATRRRSANGSPRWTLRARSRSTICRPTIRADHGRQHRDRDAGGHACDERTHPQRREQTRVSAGASTTHVAGVRNVSSVTVKIYELANAAARVNSTRPSHWRSTRLAARTSSL